ncbi:DnaT-like ssDNA-binding protein [uncultured Roseibium sp.]|uniref:DnaT-like ssDNA-binding protein n=1 Tax=uncultured Roseibium sp. TaxID=1936171 RepID=UPI0026074454|nr:DnaT-like ssDNA-binding protein [uncultured Roseibium sp.]
MALDATVGGASADSYVTVAEMDTYFSGRGVTSYDNATTAEKEFAAKDVTFFIDSKYAGAWKGSIVADSQALSHPRSELKDLEGRSIATTAIAPQVKNAVFSMVEAGLTDENLFVRDEAEGRIIETENVVGPIEERIVYQQAVGSSKSYPQVDLILKPLLKTGGGKLVRN